MRIIPNLAVCAIACLMVASSCTDDAGDDASLTTTTAQAADSAADGTDVVVFSGQGNHLDAYATEPEEGSLRHSAGDHVGER
jgi:hypothetical protein